ncbi:sodium-coupled monocarboxylate transporter 1-like protein 2, partial [Dinothrombium tinctorium]
MTALIGIFFWIKSRNNQTNQDYLMGSRNLSVFPVTMSLAASFMSSSTILGVPAEIYLLGTQYVFIIFMILLSGLLAANVFMPIYYDLKLTSINKYLYLRFETNSIRVFGSFGFLLCTLLYMAVALYGPALALSSVTPFSVTASILAVGIVCTFYTAVGGIKAVVWTDVFQCILMILGLCLVIISGIKNFGFVKPFQIAETEER